MKSTPTPRSSNTNTSRSHHPDTSLSNPSNNTPTPPYTTLNASTTPSNSPIQNRSPKEVLFDNIKFLISTFFSSSPPLIPPFINLPSWIVKGVIYNTSPDTTFSIIKSDGLGDLLRVEDGKFGDVLFYCQANLGKRGGAQFRRLAHFNAFQVNALRGILSYQQPLMYPCGCRICPSCCCRESGYKTLQPITGKYNSLSHQLNTLKEYAEKEDSALYRRRNYLRYATRTNQEKWRRELQGEIEIIEQWKDDPNAGCKEIDKALCRLSKKKKILKDRGRMLPTPHYFLSISLARDLHFVYSEGNDLWFSVNTELSAPFRADNKVKSTINRLRKKLLDSKRQKERTRTKALQNNPENENHETQIDRISAMEMFRAMFNDCVLEEIHNGFPDLVISSRTIVHPWGVSDLVPNVHSLISCLALPKDTDLEQLPDTTSFVNIHLSKEALERMYRSALEVWLNVTDILSRTWAKDEIKDQKEYRRWRENLTAVRKNGFEIPEECIKVQTRQPDELLRTLRYMLADQRGNIKRIRYFPEKEQVEVKFRKTGIQTLPVFELLRRLAGEDGRQASLREIKSGLYCLKDRKNVCETILRIQSKTSLKKIPVCILMD